MIPPLHRWVSQTALRSFGFSKTAVRIIGQTSQWTDWYRWTDNLANASTPNDEAGRPQDSERAATACSALLREYCQRLAASDLNEQFVWLGFALHLAQDLASHQGRTDVEHTVQILWILPNPDWSWRAIRQGQDYSRRVLMAVRDRLGPDWNALVRADGARLLTVAEAKRLLGPRDISWPSFWKTMLMFRHYARLPRAQKQIRWDTDTVLANGLAR